MSPDVSIVVPVYNRPLLVREAVESALREAHGFALEVIVVDDASTDETWDVIQSLAGVRALRMPANSGQCAARNHGLDEARGAFVKFLDSDDVLVEGHLARELAAARESGADIVVSGWLEVDAGGRAKESAAPRFTSVVDDLLAGRSVPTSAALYVRRPELRWDPSLRKLDDWDFFIHAALGARGIATIAGPAYEMRAHGGIRVTDASMLLNAREHHIILHKLERRLANEGALTDARRKRLAQYFYKELRVLSLHDRAAFDAALRHIFELDPHFVPRDEERQAWMRAAARLLGTRNAVLLHSAVKRAIKGRAPGELT